MDSLDQSELSGAEVPGTPALPRVVPEHVRSSRIVASVVQSLPFPIGEITSIYLEVPYGYLRVNGDAMFEAEEIPAVVAVVSGICEGEGVPYRLQVADGERVVELGCGEEFFQRD